MASYERNYGTARAVFVILEIAGWIVVVFGVIVMAFSVRDFNTDIFIGAALIEIPVIVRLYSVMIGVAVAINGIFIVAFVQSFRANVDAAELTRDLLNIAKAYSSPGKVDFSPVSSDRPTESSRYCATYNGTDIYVTSILGEEWFVVKEKTFPSVAAAKAFIDEGKGASSVSGKIPIPDLSETRLNKGEERLAETFMGIDIYQKHDGHYIKDKWFANLDAAKAFVKKALDEGVKGKAKDD